MHIGFRILISVLLILLLFTGCRKDTAAEEQDCFCGQSYAQLHLLQPDTEPEPEPAIAAWIPYFTVTELISSDQHTTRDNIMNYLRDLQDTGINTVFVHVCAFGESIYPSAYYPQLPAAEQFDLMQLFSDACRELGLSFHAWLNPLRLQTKEYTEAQSGDSLLQKWHRNPELRAENLSEWDGRYYLNPAAESTGAFLVGAITELIETYHPDGIHIDDYFYPTVSPEFDAPVFRASGADDLAAWRRGIITSLIQQMYAAVKNADPDIVFSVSPQGNPKANSETQFADVPAWIGETQCCDWIIPQLYYGYENESLPFSELLRQWAALPRNENVKLLTGLAVYKYGQSDPFAGSGADEWLEEKYLPAGQAADALGNSAVSGIALYHGDAVRSLPPDERDALKQVLTAHHHEL
ncbi:MAG: family 10 glycosylhydrolase [Oscillospiraceae bacterium]|nr:family 10 glycosylhydrolase [Oscillospiraceae bacterium]